MPVLKQVTDSLSSPGMVVVYSYYLNNLCLSVIAVQEKLNELLDADGGISKRKVSPFASVFYIA